MSGPLHRFRAMHRWWITLAVLIGVFAIRMFGVPTDTTEWIAFGIVSTLLWVLSTALIVTVPRTRAFILFMFLMLVIFDVTEVLDLPIHWSLPIVFGAIFVVTIIASKTTLAAHLSGQVRIARPLEEVARMMRCRETTSHWSWIVDRIERHPDRTGHWLAHTKGPIAKALPTYNIEIIEEYPGGGFKSRSYTDDLKTWGGAVTEYRLERRGPDTIVRFNEVSRANILSVAMFWLDRLGQDAMHSLKCHLEGTTDWSIGAGSHRWWPSWKSPPDASVF